MDDNKQQPPQAAATQTPIQAPAANDQNEVFARKERQLRKLQQELAEERSKFEGTRKQYETDYIPKNRLKEDLWGVLNDVGVNYDAVTEQLLSQPQDPASKALMSKIKALEDKLAAGERMQQEQQTNAINQARKQLTGEVKMFTSSGSDFELIESTGSHDAVVELIESRFNQTGELLSVAQASQEVEEYLLNEAYKVAQAKKVQAKFKPAEAAPSAPASNQPTKTITQSMSAPGRPTKSWEEKRARAIAMLKGEAQ